MTPTALTHAVADALGIDVSLVIQRDRRLAEVNLRTSSGRGNNAAVNERDAATLIVAVLAGVTFGSRRDRMIESTVEILGATLAPRPPKPHPALKHFSAITKQPNCTLADALIAFLDDAAAGNVELVLGKTLGNLNSGFQFQIERPDTIARMKFDLDGNETVFEFSGASDILADRQETKFTISLSALPFVRIAKKLRA